MIGVTEIACAVGGSMGGMQALEFALEVTRPQTKSVVSLCSSGRHQPWQIGISECQRQAIYADPKWKNGNFSKEDPPTSGLGVARMMAMVTYRTHPAYWTKFGREFKDFPARQVSKDPEMTFEVEGYLHSQGKKFLER